MNNYMDTLYPSESQEELELPMYDLSTVLKATEDFSVSNKLGEGGFGPVYKVKIHLKNITLLSITLETKISRLHACTREF